MDAYEVRSIAEDAAQSIARSVRDDLMYEIDRLKRDLDALERALDQERSDRRHADEEISGALA